MSRLSWDIEITQKDVKALDSGDVPGRFQPMLIKAVAAQVRLIKDIRKVLSDKVLSAWSDEKNLIKHVKMLEINVTKIEHVQNWDEMPDETRLSADGLNILLVDIATSTEQANQLMEMAKGYIKSQK